MIIDPISQSLEKRKLWRRAATRYLYLLSLPGNTEEEINWLVYRREYCADKAKQDRPNTVLTDSDTRFTVSLPIINTSLARGG